MARMMGWKVGSVSHCLNWDLWDLGIGRIVGAFDCAANVMHPTRGTERRESEFPPTIGMPPLPLPF